MKRIFKIMLFTAAIAAAAALPLAGLGNVLADGAGEEVTVVYRLRAFQTKTEKFTAGTTATEYTVSGFHRGVDDSLISEDGLTTEWFIDEACTEGYDFSQPLSENLNLYGIVRESSFDGDRDLYGWNTAVGKIYAGNPIYNRAVSGDNFTFPMSVSDTDGAASFNFVGGGYSVNYLAFDISKPFSVEVDFGNIGAIYTSSICNISLYHSMGLARAGTVYGHQDGGAMAYLRFWYNYENAGLIQNTANYASESSPKTKWSDTNGTTMTTSAFMAAYLNENSKVEFTFHIGESSSYATVGETKVLDLACTAADFNGGIAYISAGAEDGGSFSVKCSQQLGIPEAQTADGNVTVSELTAKNGFLTVKAEVTSGYRLAASVEGEAVEVKELSEGLYAVGLPRFITEDFTVLFSAEKSEAGGCKNGDSAAALFPALLIALAAVFSRFSLKRR